MFESHEMATTISIVMRSPIQWRYAGIKVVPPLVEPAAFMITKDAISPGGEECLVSTEVGLRTELCLAAIAAGDGREVFAFSKSGQVRSSASGTCLAVQNGDMADGGHVVFEDCDGALDAGDGRSVWELVAGGHLQARNGGSQCLGMRGAETTLNDCQIGSTAVLVAVRDVDATVASHVRDTAVLLTAAVARQDNMLARLRHAMRVAGACQFLAAASYAHHNGSFASVGSGRSESASSMPHTDIALQAVSGIYTALGVDMLSVRGLLDDSTKELEHMHAGLALPA